MKSQTCQPSKFWWDSPNFQTLKPPKSGLSQFHQVSWKQAYDRKLEEKLLYKSKMAGKDKINWWYSKVTILSLGKIKNTKFLAPQWKNFGPKCKVPMSKGATALCIQVYTVETVRSFHKAWSITEFTGSVENTPHGQEHQKYFYSKACAKDPHSTMCNIFWAFRF